MTAEQQALDCLRTVRDFIRWGASRMNAAEVFFGHGTDNAIDEAAALVLHALRLAPALAESYLDAALTRSEKRAVLALLEQRIAQRKPAAYLTRQAWFMGLSFYVDERVLIPRSPLAEIIEQRFSPWLFEPDGVNYILDLCAGSGCIGIACAYAFANAEVDLADISLDALAVARRNISDHGLDERVSVVRSDLFAALGDRRYNIIVSNPPYVSHAELDQLPAEYGHEPRLGLAAGESGLDIVIEILRQAADYLDDGGLLIVEVGNSQYALSDAYPEVPFVWLEFEHGGDGVLLLTAEQLQAYRARFDR